MKIVILGSNSYLSKLIKHALQNESHDFFDFSRSNGKLVISKDFSNIENIVNDIAQINPDVIINCIGIGQIREFSELSRSEIESEFVVNAEFPTMIWKEINSFSNLKFALNISSVSADLPSPMFASYSASKAYISKIIETINAENFVNDKEFVITDAHLFNFKNSHNFSNGNNDVDPFSVDRIAFVLKAMFNKERKVFEEQFTEVKKRSEINYENFVRKSYEDKKERVSKKFNIGYLTGSFDMFHFGHINLIRRASHLCDSLVIGIHQNGDRKGVKFVHSLDERILNLKSLRFVSEVIVTSGEDDADWELVKYNTLFVGSDYKGTDRFEKYEKSLDGKAKIVYLERTAGVSSTQLRELEDRKIK